MKTFTVKIGKGPDEMTFDECMTHIKRVLFWDYIDGEWCDVVPLSDRRWEELAGYIRGAHEREVDALKTENTELRYKVHVLEGGNKGLQILNGSLKVNNDNLRELVYDFALFAEDAVNKYGIELEAGHDVEAPPAEWKECLYELEMLVNRMRELGIEASNEHS